MPPKQCADCLALAQERDKMRAGWLREQEVSERLLGRIEEARQQRDDLTLIVERLRARFIADCEEIGHSAEEAREMLAAVEAGEDQADG